MNGEKKNLYVLGPHTHSEVAAREAVKLLAVKTAPIIQFTNTADEVFDAVVKERSYGVVATWNTGAGIVPKVFDFWFIKERQSLNVIGEIELEIEHCLAAKPGASIKDITTVISHPHALAQCRSSIFQSGIKREKEARSTASAAMFVAENNILYLGAITTRRAAKHFGLKILKENFEDKPGENTTLFHVLGFEKKEQSGKDRTSFLVTVSDRNWYTGCERWLMTPNQLGKYGLLVLKTVPYFKHEQLFYCQANCHEESEAGKEIFQVFRRFGAKIIILGSFPQAQKVKERRD